MGFTPPPPVYTPFDDPQTVSAPFADYAAKGRKDKQNQKETKVTCTHIIANVMQRANASHSSSWVGFVILAPQNKIECQAQLIFQTVWSVY